MSRKKYYSKQDMDRRMIRFFRSKEHWRLKYKDLRERYKQLKAQPKDLIHNKSQEKIKRLEQELKIVTKLYWKLKEK